MPFLPPNQQCQSTEGTVLSYHPTWQQIHFGINHWAGKQCTFIWRYCTSQHASTTSLKSVPSHGAPGPPSNTKFHRPTQVYTQNSISNGSAISEQLTCVPKTDIQWHASFVRPTQSYGIFGNLIVQTKKKMWQNNLVTRINSLPLLQHFNPLACSLKLQLQSLQCSNDISVLNSATATPARRPSVTDYLSDHCNRKKYQTFADKQLPAVNSFYNEFIKYAPYASL